MALSPLIVQRPSVSLIGGKELPKASGEGVRVADLSNSFAQLSAVLATNEDKNKAIDDQMQGVLDAEKYVSEGVTKDPLGNYSTFPKLNGSPEYIASFTNTLEQNTRSDLERLANTDMAEIQARPDIETPKKLALMQGLISGYIDALAPQFRPAARQHLTTEYGQRENAMIAQDTARNFAAQANGLELRINEATKAAISAASAGVDYTQHTQKIYKALDEEVGLKLITQQTADDQKTALGRFVISAGTQRQIAQRMAKGDIDPDEALAFGDALTSGGSSSIHYDEDYTPGQIGFDKRDTGQLPMKQKIISSDQMRELLPDEAALSKMGEDIKQLANRQKEYLKSIEPQVALQTYLRNAGPTDRVPSALQDDLDKIASTAIVDRDAFDPRNPDGVASVVTLVLAANYMPKPVAAKLKNMLNGSPADQQTALTIWNRIRSAKEGEYDKGAMVVETMSPPDVVELDAAMRLMNQLVGSGADNARQMQVFNDTRAKLAKPENNIEYWRGQYRDKTGGTDFASAARGLFLDHYDTLSSMPPEYMKELEESYRIAMTMGTQPDPVQTLNDVFDLMTHRYAPSELFIGGMSPVSHNGDGNPWPNPEGYKKSWIGIAGYGMPVGFVHPNQWINDFTVEQVHHNIDNGRLILDDPAVAKAVNDALAAGGGELPIGTKLFFSPTTTSPNQTQFSLRVNMGDGTTVPLMVRDAQGRPTPLLVDPGIVLSQIAARGPQRDDIELLKTTTEAARTLEVQSQLDKTGISTFDPQYGEILNDDVAFQRWFGTQPPDWQADFLAHQKEAAESIRKAQQRYKDKMPTDFGGQSVTPELLNEPKASGTGVTLGAIDAIEQVLPDGTGGQFMANVAMAESNAGRHPDTFRAAGDRGIWQVNDGPKGALVEVRRRARIPGSSIYAAAQKLKPLGIDVANLTASDLDRPIANAAVARLYFMTVDDQIPQDEEGQARLWKSLYNTEEGAGSEESFLASAGKLIVSPAYASTEDPKTRSLAADGPGMVTDMAGNAYPANFTATLPATQTSLLRLSAAFGRPLRVTPHGGTQPDARSSTSQHHRRTATDIYVADWSDADKTRFIAMAIKMGYRGIGGYGAGDGVGTIHIDLRGGGRHSGLGLWWRHRAGKDSDWTTGQKWFVDGVRQGMAMTGRLRG